MWRRTLPRLLTVRDSQGILAALVKVVIGLVAGASMLVLVLSLVLTHRLPWQIRDRTEHLADVVKLAFAVVAGLGGAVALVVAYRRQRDLEVSRFTEQFGAAASQLGGPVPAIRLAGVYAMAALADEWLHHRQQCIDVLCAYLRLPYSADPSDVQLSTVTTERSVFSQDEVQTGRDQRTYQFQPNDREVRLTIIRLIRDHLREGAQVNWQGHDFDFTGAAFDGGDFSGVEFTSGKFSFVGAKFISGAISFEDAKFGGDEVNFARAVFSGAYVSFYEAVFSGGRVSFDEATFGAGRVNFMSTEFTGARVSFSRASFGPHCAVDFVLARFTAGQVGFTLRYADMPEVFAQARFVEPMLDFNGATFSGGSVDLAGEFVAGTVDFKRATFSGASIDFRGARFDRGEVDCRNAEVSGGYIRLDSAGMTNNVLKLDMDKIPIGVIVYDNDQIHGAESTDEAEHSS